MELKKNTLYLWLRSRGKLVVAIIAQFIAVVGVVFPILLRWFVSTRV